MNHLLALQLHYGIIFNIFRCAMETVWTLAVNKEFVLSCGTFLSVKFCDYKV